MARNRMLNPEFFLDEELAKAKAHTRLLYQGLWTICDDNHATFPNRPEWIKAQIFPYEPEVDIVELLKELEDLKKIIPFTHEEKSYFFLKNFFKYQRVDKPSREKYPPSPIVVDDYSANTLAKKKISKDKISKDKLKEKDDEKATLQLPSWVDVSLWNDWIKYRKQAKIKNPEYTEMGRQKLFAQFEPYKEHFAEIINTSIANGWQGLFPPKFSKPSTVIKAPTGKYAKFNRTA